MCTMPQRLRNLLKPPSSWRPSIQTHEPLGDSPHSSLTVTRQDVRSLSVFCSLCIKLVTGEPLFSFTRQPRRASRCYNYLPLQDRTTEVLRGRDNSSKRKQERGRQAQLSYLKASLCFPVSCHLTLPLQALLEAEGRGKDGAAKDVSLGTNSASSQARVNLLRASVS